MNKCRYPYVIQCIDAVSGKVGDFAYDPAKYKSTGKFHAITPVFDDLQGFYDWTHKTGFMIHHGRSHEATEVS